MTKDQSNLLQLLSHALFNTQTTATLTDEIRLEAQAQAVSSLITTDNKVLADNIRVLHAHAQLTELLQNIPFTTFKGYASAYYYPKPSYRPMGDVDFIVDAADYEKTVDRLIKAGYIEEHSEHERHRSFRFRKVEIELHSEIKGIPNGKDGIATVSPTAEERVRALLSDLIIIMAGGRGMRISAVASDIPKPMIKIEGKPVLEHELECLRDQGFTDIILTISHLGNIIMDYFGDGSGISPVTGKPFGVHIEYYFEKGPLGNAGALIKIKDKLDSDFLLLNADAVFDVDFNRFVAFHREHGGLVTLFTHPNSHPYDSGLIIADKSGSVEKWLAKEDERPEYYRNRVNAGLHVINPIVLEQSGIDASKVGTIDENGKPVKVDLDRQLLKPLAGTGKMFCYDSPEYVKDMGTPERYYSVCADCKAGRILSKNLKNKQKAVFLDRDGTINQYVGFLRNINDFTLIDGVAEAVKKINASGYLAIVVTNQPVIARGEVSYEELEEIHNKLETLLGKEGAYLDAIYYCPHHPHKGYKGERPELKIDCECRKSKPGMLLKAAKDFNTDLSRSWMIGDGENDIKAGQNAGCKTVLIGEGAYGQTVTVPSLKDFADQYLNNEILRGEQLKCVNWKTD